MDWTSTHPWTWLLLPTALLVGGGLLLMPSAPAGTGATRPPAAGDPFLAAGADTTAAPRVLLPTVHAVSDAVEAGDGWVLLDRRNDRIHALDKGGAPRWTAGGEGRGPGELLRPVALTVVDSTVVVADARGSTLDRFGPEGSFLGRTHLRVTDCLGSLVRGIAPWGEGTVILLRLCLDPGTGAMDARADRVDIEGRSTTLATLPLKNLRRPGQDLFATGVLGARRPVVYLGTTTSPCVQAYEVADGDADGPPSVDPLGPVCLPETAPVRVPEEARRRAEEALSRRPLARVLGLRPPETLPPFDRVFPTNGGLVFRTLTSLEERALVWARPGDAHHRLPVPANEHTFVGVRSVLVSWQEVAGTALRIVETTGATERR